MIKEYTRPLEQGIDSDKNIFSVLEERVERTPDDNLVEYKNAQGEWVAFTAAEFKNKVVALAKGLIARGVMPGDSVSIIAHTCWQWTALDVAIMSIGALTVPVYETNSPAQVKMIFSATKSNPSVISARILATCTSSDLVQLTRSSNTAARSPTPNSLNVNKRSKAPI